MVGASKKLAAQMQRPTAVKVNVQDMAKLMANSDLAIGAGGSTSWERCCLGLPSLIGVIADNQKFIAEALQLAGAVKLFGSVATIGSIDKLLEELLDDLGELARMSVNAARVTDGCGTDDVAARLLAVGHA